MANDIYSKNVLQGKDAARGFEAFMRRLIAVPHSELKARLDAEKEAKQTLKSSSSAPSSTCKD